MASLDKEYIPSIEVISQTNKLREDNTRYNYSLPVVKQPEPSRQTDKRTMRYIVQPKIVPFYLLLTTP